MVPFAFLCPMMALVATPDELRRSGGLGVINMRERVLQLHGTFEFDSAPGRGTTVKAEVPFRPGVVKWVAVRNLFARSLFGNPLRILKPSRSHSPENAAANVRQIGNAARLHMGYGSSI